MAKNIKMDLVFNRSKKEIAEDSIKGDKGQLFLANEAKKLMDPYVPADKLVMSKGAKAYVEGGKGVVEYPGPYAKFQYEGNVMVGVKSNSPWANKNESKIVTGRKLHFSTFPHSLATSQWDKAMLTARRDDLVRATQNYLKRGG